MLGRVLLDRVGDRLHRLWQRHVCSSGSHVMHDMSRGLLRLRKLVLLLLLGRFVLVCVLVVLQQLQSRVLLEQRRRILLYGACWILRSVLGA